MNLINRSNPLIFALQGLLMLGIGVFILIRPDVTLAALTSLLGIILIVSGGFLAFSAWYGRETTNQFLLFEGVVVASLGLLFVLFPGLLANVFIVLLGIITFLSGLVNLWLLIKVRAKITSTGFLRNTLVLLFGIFLLANPMRGQEAIAMIIGIFALVFGIITLHGAYRIFRVKNN
ncbi:MAG: DUF308 domain-containing protein [Bacteroidales bacterium]